MKRDNRVRRQSVYTFRPSCNAQQPRLHQLCRSARACAPGRPQRQMAQEQCPSTAQHLSLKRPAAVRPALNLMAGTISHPYLGPHQVLLAQTRRRHLSSRSGCRALINANSMQCLVRPGKATTLLRRARNVRLVCRLWRDLADAPGSPVWRHVRLKRTEPSEPRWTLSSAARRDAEEDGMIAFNLLPWLRWLRPRLASMQNLEIRNWVSSRTPACLRPRCRLCRAGATGHPLAAPGRPDGRHSVASRAADGADAAEPAVARERSRLRGLAAGVSNGMAPLLRP